MSVYKELFRQFVLRELRLRFRTNRGFSKTKVAMALVQQLLLVAFYFFTIDLVFQAKLDRYALFAAVGFLHWQYFATSITRGCRSVQSAAGLVTSARFSLALLPLAVTVAESLFFCLVLFFFFALFSALGGVLWVGLFLYPFVLLLQVILLVGINLLTSAVQVYRQGFADVLSSSLRLLFWATPILYSYEMVPEWAQTVLYWLNPMVSYLVVYRDLLYRAQWPGSQDLFMVTAWAVLAVLLGGFVFRRWSGGMADEL